MESKKMSLLKIGNNKFNENKYKEAIQAYKKLIVETKGDPSLNIIKDAAIFNIKIALARVSNSFHDTSESIRSIGVDKAVSVINEIDDIEAQRKSGFFDIDYYLTANPDVANAGIDPVRHFHMHGWKEGRSPSKDFNVKFYLSEHGKKFSSEINPLLYHIREGAFRGFPISKYNKNAFNQANSKIFSEVRIGPDLFNDVATTSSVYNLLKNKDIKADLTPEEEQKIYNIAFSKPLSVSVIVPMWNRQNSILRAIDSILNQSYQASEIIIIDDGSNDGSCEVVRKNYSKHIKSGKIILLENDHLGVSAARNAGLHRAGSDIISYLDSDNEWNKDYLLIMMALFNDNSAVSTAYAGLKHIDIDKGTKKYLGVSYDRKTLLQSNYIDMNVFCHRRTVSDQVGGFDESIKRLVDWDFILRCTKLYTPLFIPFCAVNYYIDKNELKNISRTVPLDENRHKVYRKHTVERLKYQLESLKIAYVLWDWPALSQTFVLEEIRWLLNQGQDVIVYYKVDPDKSAVLDFDVEARKVVDHEQLQNYLVEDDRNIIHSHFAYPAVTLLTYPAAKGTGIPFTFYAHAVDIFHNDNKKRNRVDEIVNDSLCIRVFVHGEYHRKILEECGVDPSKIFYAMQAIDLDKFDRTLPHVNDLKPIKRIAFIGRFVEKKGIEVLLSATELLADYGFHFDLYGYGPLYDDMVNYANNKNLNNVSFKGALEGSKALNRVFDKSDAIVVPSVVAKNGDTEGFPTIIFEAMSSNIPVIASAVSSVPSYLKDGVEALLVEPNNSFELANKIKELAAMPEAKRYSLICNAKKFLNFHVGVEKLIQSYIDCWFDNTIDIFLVTFNNEKYENSKESFEIIRRVLRHTNSPMSLTIVDNNSEKKFREELIRFSIGEPRIRLILNTENGFCGPGSNTALWSTNSRYSIYVCSKEGFIAKHGWDRVILGQFRYKDKSALGGHLVHLPKYTLGDEMKKHPDFLKFRNKDFVNINQNHIYRHVQGGVYIVDRVSLKDLCGFNPQLPQAGMDIEFSYYAESLGYNLVNIPQIKSITTKTLPRIHSALDENVVIAHPFTLEEADRYLDHIHIRGSRVCNICGSIQGGELNTEDFSCCGSTPFGRTVFKEVAYYPSAFRGKKALTLTHDNALIKSLSDRAYLVEAKSNITEKEIRSMIGKQQYDLIIIDFECFDFTPKDSKSFVFMCLDLVKKLIGIKGRMIFSLKYNSPFLSTELLSQGFCNVQEAKSEAICDDWRPLYFFENKIF